MATQQQIESARQVLQELHDKLGNTRPLPPDAELARSITYVLRFVKLRAPDAALEQRADAALLELAG